MERTKQFSVCYIINEKEYIVCQSDENVKVAPVITEEENSMEVSLSIENCSGQDIYLKYATLWGTDTVTELQVGKAPFEVYRSGRHKNDMPGTFTLGVNDARLKDVLGAMSESGDKTDADGQNRNVVSDHLTVIKGSEKSLVVEFTGGRKQLFETVCKACMD